jgi:hypothetical protein
LQLDEDDDDVAPSLPHDIDPPLPSIIELDDTFADNQVLEEGDDELKEEMLQSFSEYQAVRRMLIGLRRTVESKDVSGKQDGRSTPGPLRWERSKNGDMNHPGVVEISKRGWESRNERGPFGAQLPAGNDEEVPDGAVADGEETAEDGRGTYIARDARPILYRQTGVTEGKARFVQTR